MIGYLSGAITIVDPTLILVDVGGIGYEVKISLNTYSKLKDSKKGKVYTYLHVKEDSHTLFGFYSTDEKSLFVKLISISGVGPSTAILMLSSMGVSEIQESIAGEDVATIKKVKGIGTKTAERIVLELKDKIRKEIGGEKTIGIVPDSFNIIRDEAMIALVTLGIQKSMAEKSINIILKNADKDVTLEEVIKLALKTT
jgi:Holliday junction DNA helicase RuvA